MGETIFSTRYSFAALKTNGSVVTWGDANFGGDCSEVDHKLINVQSVVSNGFAFAALKEDGTVVTWGDCNHGGDSSYVVDLLINIKYIFALDTINKRFMGNSAKFVAVNQNG